VAIQREDYDFLTWEHPMVNESMESIRDTELGNAAVASIKVKGLKSGTVLLESCYTISTSAPKSLQLERFLGLNPLRLLVDVRGKNLSSVVSHDAMNQLTRRMPKDLARRACQKLRHEVDEMIKHSAKIAQPHLANCTELAKNTLAKKLQNEIVRLKQLAKLNPAVRPEEIQNLQQRMTESLVAIERAELQVQGLRLIITQ
jgi:ATP-dependent helicase HepA